MEHLIAIEDDRNWLQEFHLDQYYGQQSGVFGMTLFSLLQSLYYEFSDRRSEVAKLLKN